MVSISKAQDTRNVTLSSNNTFSQLVEVERERLNALKSEICAIVDQYSSEVKTGGDGGGLIYPNWVYFVKLANKIEELNEQWDEEYGKSLDLLIQNAIEMGLTDVGNDDEHGKDLLADIIEDDYLQFEDEIASLCFEQKFKFQSLRLCLRQQDDDYFDNNSSIDWNNVPSQAENFDDEEFWTLINCEKQYTILDTYVTEDMLEGLSENDKKDILTTIKDVVGVISGVVQLAETVSNLLADCAGTTTTTDRNMKYGFPIPNTNDKEWIGYKMKQRGVLFDFNKTFTLIKGKARLWKENKKGKLRRDRRNSASIGYCAFEWNGCDGKDWPENGTFFNQHHVSGRKKKKIVHRHPFALQITKSTHFVQFKFGKNGKYVDSRMLLGMNGCVQSSQNYW
jgi:hypothetical protein